MKAIKWSRKIHRWAAILTALPVLIAMLSGIILQMKKELDWVQPPTKKGAGKEPALSFDRILDIATMVPEAGIKEWQDIDRLDVRPGKGVIKVRAKNRWEIQIDTTNGEVLQVAVLRSDLIESIHDGSFLSPSQLGGEIGVAALSTGFGYSDNFSTDLAVLNWTQVFNDKRAGIAVGRLAFDVYLDAFMFQTFSRGFFNRAFTFNPTLATTGIGALGVVAKGFDR